MTIKKMFAFTFLALALAAAPALAQDAAGGGAPLVALPSLSPVVEKATPAVVNIFATKVVKGRQTRLNRSPFGGPNEDLFDQFFNFPRQMPDRKENILGSGFIFDPSGYVVTNNHMVEGAEDIKVKLNTGEEIQAEIIGRDPKTDLALLKLKKEGRTYPHLALGDSSRLKVGDWVVAIGNPYGMEHTVTAGILSALGRNIQMGPYDDFLQTDASINVGNSGGPLLNLAGEVIGINTAIASGGGGGSVGIGFAIPANMAKSVVNQLKDKGRVVRGWMGVVIQPVSEDMAKAMGLGEARGALIGDIDPSGPSVEAKIQRGDIVLKFDGKDIKEWRDLSLIVADTPVGKKVKLVVFRDKKEVTLDLTVAEMKEEAAELTSGPASSVGKLGLTLKEITPEIAARQNLSEKDGLYVAGIEAGSPAAEAGFSTGDIVVEVNNKPIKNASDYRQAVTGKKKGDILIFLVKRGANTMFLTISMPE